MPLFAASVVDDPAQLEQHRLEQQRREQEIDELFKRPPPPAPIARPPAVPKLLAEGICQVVHRVSLYGADHMPQKARGRLIENYLEKCLYNADIELLIKQLQDWYLENGYVTSRVALKVPQASLDLGNLEVYVREGYIGQISLGEDYSFDRRRLNAALPDMQGEVLNIRDIDRGVEILNRSFAHNIQMQIKPSDIPAHSNIDLTERRNTNLSVNGKKIGRHMGRQKLSYQQSNGGSEATGEILNAYTFNRDNLIGINDDIQASWTESYPNNIGSKENTNNTFRYQSRYGKWSYVASYYDGFNVRTVDGVATPFLSSGDTINYTLEFTRQGYRDSRNKLEYKISGKHSDRQNFINDTLVEVSSRKVSTLDVGASYTRFLNGGSLLINPTISAGMPWFDAITDAVDIADPEPRAEYTNYKLYISYQQGFASKSHYPFSWQINLNSQMADTILYSENQFILGGEYSVRGYKDNVLSGEVGFSLRNDFIFPVGSWWLDRQKHPYLSPLSFKIFYDYGEVETLVDNKMETLEGYGWGISYNYRWFSLSYSRAMALRMPSQFTTWEDWVTYYSASVNMTF